MSRAPSGLQTAPRPMSLSPRMMLLTVSVNGAGLGAAGFAGAACGAAAGDLAGAGGAAWGCRARTNHVHARAEDESDHESTHTDSSKYRAAT